MEVLEISNMSTELIKLEVGQRALAEAISLDEIKNFPTYPELFLELTECSLKD